MWRRLRLILERLRQSYWFLPALLTLAAAIAALLLVTLDRRFVAAGLELQGLPQPGADGARAILSTVAGSAITVAGVAFSIMVVALVLTASNYGPRLLPNFLRDRGNQLTLGTFVAAFAYSTLVLMSVGSGDDAFVPRLAVLGSLALALATVVVLIYFLHHASASIRVDRIVEEAAEVLDEAIRRTFPVARDNGEEAMAIPEELGAEGTTIAATGAGYVRLVDPGHLVAAAAEQGARLRIVVRLGDYVILGSPLAVAIPVAGDELAERVRSGIVLGSTPVASEDPFYAAAQLWEMAVRALSLGINDPRTAIECVERLAAAIVAADRRATPQRLFADDQGTPRVLLPPLEAAELVEQVFPPITAYACDDATVLAAELRVLGELLGTCRGERMRVACARQAEEVLAAAEADRLLSADRERVKRQWQAVLARREIGR